MKSLLFILVLVQSVIFTDDFSSRNLSENNWSGDWDNLIINSNQQLQNNVSWAAESMLWHPCEVAIDAEWAFWCHFYGTCSAYNLLRMYIMESDSMEGNGYFVQVGGANRNITLCRQEDGKVTKLIENADRKQVLDANASVAVRLTRDERGQWNLFSQVEGVDMDEQIEGDAFANMVQSRYVALLFKNSSQRGTDLYMDDIVVQGDRQDEPLIQQNNDGTVEINREGESITLQRDGFEDEVRLVYTCPDDTYHAHLHIYSSDGRLIRTLCQNRPMGMSGILVWDGTDQQGEDVTIGVYVMLLEITSPAHAPIRKKYPVAVVH
ncbi:MAG: hypothetical protein MJZ75_05825 [Paludibacteraceae bacterium]|nr:hypothetical protein [Paludibacteraceae bacterium]